MKMLMQVSLNICKYDVLLPPKKCIIKKNISVNLLLNIIKKKKKVGQEKKNQNTLGNRFIFW